MARLRLNPRLLEIFEFLKDWESTSEKFFMKFDSNYTKKLHDFFQSNSNASRLIFIKISSFSIQYFKIFLKRRENLVLLFAKILIKNFTKLSKLHSQNQFFTTFEEKSIFWIENDKIAHIRDFFRLEISPFSIQNLEIFFSNDVKIS